MCSAAIVAGNCVVFKPSNLSPVVGHHLVELFREVGLPDGVFNYTPGRGSVMGDYLVDSPKVGIIAFTGSMEVGSYAHLPAGSVVTSETVTGAFYTAPAG